MKRANSFEESAFLNNTTYAKFFKIGYSAAISSFKWENCPKSVNSSYAERKLFFEGKVLFFKDPVLGYLCLPFTYEGGFDEYGEPIKRHVIGYNGYTNTLSNEDSVIIYNNTVKSPCACDIQQYAIRLYEIERAIDVNVKAQKAPITFVVPDEKTRLSVLNYYKNMDGNVPFITVSDGFPTNTIQYLNQNPPEKFPQLQMLLKQKLDDMLSYLGIDSNINNKAERLISPEVVAGMGYNMIMRNSRIMSRKESSEKIKEMFPDLIDFNIIWNYDSQIHERNVNKNGSIYPDVVRGDGDINSTRQNDNTFS